MFDVLSPYATATQSRLFFFLNGASLDALNPRVVDKRCDQPAHPVTDVRSAEVVAHQRTGPERSVSKGYGGGQTHEVCNEAWNKYLACRSCPSLVEIGACVVTIVDQEEVDERDCQPWCDPSSRRRRSRRICREGSGHVAYPAALRPEGGSLNESILRRRSRWNSSFSCTRAYKIILNRILVKAGSERVASESLAELTLEVASLFSQASEKAHRPDGDLLRARVDDHIVGVALPER